METWRYFYHADHLGSTSWVTDSAKNGVQYCEYLPYGEPFIDQRSTTWSSRYTFSGKERDSETGYSYFGARYYHSDLSIWLSVDPMSDKYPNLTPYNYCANNPVILVDPDGRENIPALLWARNNMSNKGIPFGQWFGGASGWNYKKGTVPTQTVCYEACFIAYMNSTDKVVSHFKKTGFATESGGFRGRLTDKGGINWFKNGDGTDRSFVTDISKGELGDIVFMGDNSPNNGHAVLLNALPILGSYTDDNGNNVETMTLNVLSTGSYTGDNHDHFGEKTYVFEKQKDGSWVQAAGENNYVFRGYGQINKDFFESE
jgi:RHS repeat-associated protein